MPEKKDELREIEKIIGDFVLFGYGRKKVTIRDYFCKVPQDLAYKIIKFIQRKSCITGKIPKLPSYNPTQKEMLDLAIRDIRAKKKGKYQLVYNKEKRTIIAKERL